MLRVIGVDPGRTGSTYAVMDAWMSERTRRVEARVLTFETIRLGECQGAYFEGCRNVTMALTKGYGLRANDGLVGVEDHTLQGPKMGAKFVKEAPIMLGAIGAVLAGAAAARVEGVRIPQQSWKSVNGITRIKGTRAVQKRHTASEVRLVVHDAPEYVSDRESSHKFDAMGAGLAVATRAIHWRMIASSVEPHRLDEARALFLQGVKI